MNEIEKFQSLRAEAYRAAQKREIASLIVSALFAAAAVALAFWAW